MGLCSIYNRATVNSGSSTHTICRRSGRTSPSIFRQCSTNENRKIPSKLFRTNSVAANVRCIENRGSLSTLFEAPCTSAVVVTVAEPAGPMAGSGGMKASRGTPVAFSSASKLPCLCMSPAGLSSSWTPATLFADATTRCDPGRYCSRYHRMHNGCEQCTRAHSETPHAEISAEIVVNEQVEGVGTQSIATHHQRRSFRVCICKPDEK